MNELGTAGTDLYDSVTAKFELDADELKVLIMAARTADDLLALEAAREGADVMVPGSMGQERVNPLFAEIRATRALVSQLLARLKLPDESAIAAKSDFNTARARKAAGARWNH
jgi:hypothetical protein